MPHLVSDRTAMGTSSFSCNSRSLWKNVCADLSISFVPVQAKEICLVRASASASPVYLEEQGQSKLFVRLGNTSQELTRRQAVEYVQSHWPKA
jgi:hypothetical protein